MCACFPWVTGLDTNIGRRFYAAAFFFAAPAFFAAGAFRPRASDAPPCFRYSAQRRFWAAAMRFLAAALSGRLPRGAPGVALCDLPLWVEDADRWRSNRRTSAICSSMRLRCNCNPSRAASRSVALADRLEFRSINPPKL